MNLILDGILAVVILIFVAVGAKRGLLRSLTHLFGTILSAILAGVFGEMAAVWIFNTLFRESLVEKITVSVNGMGVDGLNKVVENLFAEMPEFVVRALEGMGISAASLETNITESGKQAAVAITDALSPVFIGFIKVLAVIVLFVLFMILVRVLANVLTTLVSIPVLGQLNTLLGAAVGLLLAIVSLWILASAVQVIIPLLTEQMQSQVNGQLHSSLIADFLVNLNPLRFMFGQ